MQLKSVFFLLLFLFSIVGPASVRFLVEDGTSIIITITEEEQQEDFKIYKQSKKQPQISSVTSDKFPLIQKVKKITISKEKTFWNCHYSDTFYPPPENV